MSLYLRDRFREGIVHAFFGGFAHKPASTWGTIKIPG